MRFFHRLRAKVEGCRITISVLTQFHGLMVPLGMLVLRVICCGDAMKKQYLCPVEH